MMAALEGLAAVAAQEGDATRAVQFLAVAQRWQQEGGQQLTELELAMQARTRQLTEAALDPAAWQHGHHWSVAQVAQVVLG